MFRIAALTDEISQDFEHALDVMLEYDVRLAELRGLWTRNISALNNEELNAAKNAMQCRGIETVGIGSPVFKSPLPKNSDEVNAQLELLRRCCGIARFFGTNLIRVFAFLPEKGTKPELTPEIRDTIIEVFSKAVKIAADEGMILGIENEHACYIGTGAHSAELMRQVNSKHLQAVWDPGNAIAAGELPYPDGYEAVRGSIVHIHVKDAVVDPESGRFTWMPVGEGIINFPGQLRALKTDGYQGALSLETHYQPEGGTREDGSRKSLENLLQILKTEVV